jgi:phosphoribosylformimino-5-aminoimidazole carboxamide ribotide isomerase
MRQAVRDGELLVGGGVRGEADLAALASIGVDAALVATALHEGTLPGPA